MSNQQLLETLKKIDSPTLANAIEKLELRNRIVGFADRTLRHLTPELGVMCGYAVTAQAVTMTPEKGVRDRDVRMYTEICAELEKLPGPGVVVMQEMTPQTALSVHCGDVMANMFKRFGAVGLVSDSAVRDLDQVREIGFHFFAPGLVASHANFRIVRTQVPVTVCGLNIEPGDLLHGDLNGLIQVPEEGRDRLPGLAAEVTDREQKVLDYLKGDEVTLEGIIDKLVH